MVKFLIKNNARVDLTTAKGNNALHMAVCGGDIATVDFLLSYIHIETFNPLGMILSSSIVLNICKGATAFLLAVEKKFLQLADFLVWRGANINAIRADRITALHLAAQGGLLEATKFLVTYGAYINAQGNTPKNQGCYQQ